MIPLPRTFYLRSTLKVAQELLGKYFIHHINGKLLSGKIVEVEAYCHNDPASHSFHGKTQRNEVMFREGGHLYVYFTYGMHFCCNIVTGRQGLGEAVLIRAIEPLAGIDIMMKNRFPPHTTMSFKSLINVSNGPAKLCKAFDISRKENGLDLTKDSVVIAQGETLPKQSIGQSPRIGIRVGLEKKWRFFVKGNPWVSK